MLPADHPVRALNADIRDDFGAHDMIVVGVVADDVATPETLGAVDELARTVATRRRRDRRRDRLVRQRHRRPGRRRRSGRGRRHRRRRARRPDHGRQRAVAPTAPPRPSSSRSSTSPRPTRCTDADRRRHRRVTRARRARDPRGRPSPRPKRCSASEMFVQMGIFAPLAGLLDLRPDAVVLPPGHAGAGRHGRRHAQRGLDDGPADRHRQHPAHHELDDPDLPDADRDPRQHPRPQRVLRPLPAPPRPQGDPPGRLRRAVPAARLHLAHHRRWRSPRWPSPRSPRCGCSASSSPSVWSSPGSPPSSSSPPSS